MHGRSALRSLENVLRRRTKRFKPAADIHLGMGFATEMPRSGAGGGRQVPLDDRELLISALDHKPTDRILTDDPANLALEFLHTRHAFSVEQWLGKNSLGKRYLRNHLINRSCGTVVPGYPLGDTLT